MSERKEIVKVYTGNLIRLKFAGGGELPSQLSGLFTDEKAADRAIKYYLTKRDGKADAQKKTSGRSKQVQ